MLYRILSSMTRSQKSMVLLALDGVYALVALAAAGILVGSPSPENSTFVIWLGMTLAVTSATLLMSITLKTHLVLLNHYEGKAIAHTSIVGALSACLGAVFINATRATPDAAYFIVSAMVFILLSCGMRFVLRAVVISIYSWRIGTKRVAIYGAGRTGQQLVAALLKDDEIQPVAFIDDNRALVGQVISGLHVISSTNLAARVETLQLDRVILAMPSLTEHAKVSMAQRLRELPCEVHSMPSFSSLIMERTKLDETKPIDFSKLLGRTHLEADLPASKETYSSKNILITGAGGTIGSEICEQVARLNPNRVVLFDHSEIALYAVHQTLVDRFPELDVLAVLGSVCHAEHVRNVFETFDIHVVLHAAAYKHVPILEDNAIEALRNNVLGTRVVAQAAHKLGAEKFVLVSTDKAVRPSSYLGFSKRFAEMIVQDLASRSQKTRFAIVRFGNVLGSSGSVVPLFRRQIAQGGPITLTHENVTRFFMTVSEAVRLVLLAGSFARGGDVFVLDMGQPVHIKQLAEDLIKTSGYTLKDENNPNGEIEIKVTGLRPGEKITEELLIGSDMLTTPHPKILRAAEVYPSELETANLLQDIAKTVENYDTARLPELTKRWAYYLGLEDAPTPKREPSIRPSA